MPQARDEAGNIWEVDAQGNPVRLVSHSAQGAQMPTDPSFVYKGPQAAAEIDKTQAQTANSAANATGQQIQNQVTQATVPAVIQKAAADAAKAEIEAQGGSANVRQDAITQYSGADQLDAIANSLEEQYNKHFKGKGLAALGEYNPFASANKVFNDTADQARGFVKNALGYTGGEGNTVGEVQLNYGPYLPQNGDRDEQILQKIGALRGLAERARQRSIATLGGVPGPNGTITPVGSQGGPTGGPGGAPGPTVWQTPHQVGGGVLTAAPAGSTTGADPVPPEYQAAYEAFVKSGNWTPDQYAAFRSRLDKHFFPDAADQSDTYKDEGARILGQLQRGGDLNLSVPPSETKLSATDQFRNNLVNNPLGAGAAGYLDMAGFGGVKALAGDKMDALGSASDSNAVGMALGQIGGALTGTSLLGKVGGLALPARANAALRMTLGKGGARFAKNAAGDIAYGAGYGGISGEGAGNDAALAGIGSVGGQALGKTLGAVVGGLKLSPAVERLRAANIPMTLGQKLGGIPQSIENAATSIPLVGDMISRRYGDSLKGLSREGLRISGEPIGFNPKAIGKEGVDQLGDAVGNYYDNVTSGVTVPIDDSTFIPDMAKFGDAAAALPDDLRRKAALAVKNRVAPISDAGQMTGEQYQQAQRGLKGYKAETTKPGFEEDYRDALALAQKALREQMERGGGQDVVQGLGKADQTYRLFKTFKNAAERADGAEYIPTASQLQDAVKATGKKFPGFNPLGQLADDAQGVLPNKLPDSGTARRVMQYGLGAAALGGGQASDSYLGTNVINPETLGLLALLTAGGTKAGQKALDVALVDRPQVFKTFGTKIRKRQGLFGSAAIPFALEAGN